MTPINYHLIWITMEGSHLNLPERIHKKPEHLDDLFFSKSMMKELIRRYGNIDQEYVIASVIVSNIKY